MKKKSFCYTLFLLMLIVLSGCNKDTNKEPNFVPADVKTLDVIGLNNKCQSNTNYMEITSFEILFIDDEENQKYENGTYIVMGLNTDMPSDKITITNDGNRGSELMFYGANNGCKLNYYNFDSITSKLYCKFDESNGTVNPSILNLKVSNREDFSFPFLLISFGNFNYCVVGGEFYYYVNFYLPLE